MYKIIGYDRTEENIPKNDVIKVYVDLHGSISDQVLVINNPNLIIGTTSWTTCVTTMGRDNYYYLNKNIFDDTIVFRMYGKNCFIPNIRLSSDNESYIVINDEKVDMSEYLIDKKNDLFYDNKNNNFLQILENLNIPYNKKKYDQLSDDEKKKLSIDLIYLN